MKIAAATLIFLLAAAPSAVRAEVSTKDAAFWTTVVVAFSSGTRIPQEAALDDESFLPLHKLVKKISACCSASCKTDKFRKNIALACKHLVKVAPDDAPQADKVQAVYAKETVFCRELKAEAAVAASAAAKASPPQGDAGNPRRKRAAKTGRQMAAALEDDKSDDVAGGPGGGALATGVGGSAVPPPPTPAPVIRTGAPAGGNEVPAAPVDAPTATSGGFSLFGIPRAIVDKAVKMMGDQKDAFPAIRLEKVEKLAAGALILLKRANGDAALAESIEWALKNKDPEVRSKNLRFLLGDADRQFERTLALKVTARIAKARKESCKKAHKPGKRFDKCFDAKPTQKEFDAARDSVFTDDPDLGLYFIGRLEYQAFMNDSLATGLLPKGSKLEPWEVGGSSMPEGSTVTVDAEAPGGEDKEGSEYLGLRYTKPDNSSFFSGSRQVKDGVENLSVVTALDGSTARSTAVFDPGSKSPEKPLRGEVVLFDGKQRMIRSETVKDGVRTVKEFNVGGKYAGEPRRIQTETTKGKKTKTSIVDYDAGTKTTVGFDGDFTMTAIPKGGKPIDPKAKGAKSAPPDERWVAKRGKVKDGKFYLEEMELGNGSVLTGTSDAQGRFSLTSIKTAEGKTMRGKTDESGHFEPWLVTEADGSGRRKIGRVMAVLGPGGTPKRFLADLTPQKVRKEKSWGVMETKYDTRESVQKIADDWIAQTGLDKAQAGALGEWLWDQVRGTNFSDAPWSLEKGAKKYDESDGYNAATLVSESPKKNVVYLRTARVQEIDDGVITEKRLDDAAAQTMAQWEKGTSFKGTKPGSVLVAFDKNAVPLMEYVRVDLMRKWLQGYSGSGSNGLVLSDAKVHQHTVLVEYHRHPKYTWRWGTKCVDSAGNDDPATIDIPLTCEDAEEVGKSVISEGSSGLSDLAGAISDVPGLSHVGKGMHTAFHKTVGYLQEDLGYESDSDPNQRLGRLASGLRGNTYSKDEALDILYADPELLQGVDEKVVEKRMKDHPDECRRLGKDCEKWAKKLNCTQGQKEPCATGDERLGIVDHAFSAAHAIEEGGTGVKILGTVANLGEMSFGSLPLMGFGAGLGALSKWKALGSVAGGFGAANTAVGVYMTTTWVVGGTANAGGFVQAARDGDGSKMLATGSQMVMDGVFAGYMVKEMRTNAQKTKAARAAAEAEGARLKEVKANEAAAPAVEPGTVLLDVSAVDPVAYKAALKTAGVEAPPAVDGVVAIKVKPGEGRNLFDALGGTGAEPITAVEWGRRTKEPVPGVHEANTVVVSYDAPTVVAPAEAGTNPGTPGARKNVKPETKPAPKEATKVESGAPKDGDGFRKFSREKFGEFEGGMYVEIVDGLEPGSTLRLRKSRDLNSGEPAKIRKRLEDLGYNVELSPEFVENYVGKRSRMKAVDAAQKADMLLGGDYSVVDGGRIEIRGSKGTQAQRDAVAKQKKALEEAGFEVKVSETDLIENYNPAGEPVQAPDVDTHGGGTDTVSLKKSETQAPDPQKTNPGRKKKGGGGEGGDGGAPAVDLAKNQKMLEADAKRLGRPSLSDPPPEWTKGDAGRPKVELTREISAEGSSGIVYEGRLGGEVVAVKVFSAPPPGGGTWTPRLEYFRGEIAKYRVMESALPTGSVPKMHGEVAVGGNPSFATELVHGKDPIGLTVKQALAITPEAINQSAAAVQQLARRNLGGMDSPQPMILTKNQTINGVARNAGDVIFMDAGALTADKSHWQKPADLSYGVALAREMALRAKPGQEGLTVAELYKALPADAMSQAKASARVLSEAAAALAVAGGTGSTVK